MRFSRYKQILAIVIVGFLVLTTYFLVWSYWHSVRQAEQASLMRLMGITNALALQIDGDEHAKMMQSYATKDAITANNQDTTYEKMHGILSRNFTANMLKTPIYTVVFDSVVGRYEFGATSAEKPYFRHPYNSYPQTMMDRYQEGAMIPMYEDEFGTWLSAFSIIRDKSGKVVALVQADEPFDVFLQKTRKEVSQNLLISLLVLALLFVTILWFLQPILRREERDKAALAAANIQIVQLDNFRKEMIANVSHDLRTPMASILGFTETLEQKKETLSDAEQSKYLKIVHAEAQRMNKMISELFDLTKLEAGQILLSREPLNLSEMAQDTLFSYQDQAKNRQIRLVTDFQSAIPLINADAFWLNRVLQNLVSNAFKYVNDGGLVKFTIFMESEMLHLKVCNSGQPIEHAHLPFIFDRYFKASNHKNDSTGLGLAISKKIIELHGGRIWAEADENITTFRFCIETRKE